MDWSSGMGKHCPRGPAWDERTSRKHGDVCMGSVHVCAAQMQMPGGGAVWCGCQRMFCPRGPVWDERTSRKHGHVCMGGSSVPGSLRGMRGHPGNTDMFAWGLCMFAQSKCRCRAVVWCGVVWLPAGVVSQGACVG
eukprot:1161909-Pelagomonas_calceolata.AAC.4